MSALLKSPLTKEEIEPYGCEDAGATDLSKLATALRVAWLTNEIPPYRAPFYQELSTTAGWNFHVFTCVDREIDRLWNVTKEFDFAVWQSYSLSYLRRINHTGSICFDDSRQVHLPIGLFWDLCRFRPHVIISGEFGARTLIATLYSQVSNCRLIVSFEGTTHTERDINFSQRLIRKTIRRAPHAYMVDGRQGEAYLQSLQIPTSSIFKIGQPVDINSFAGKVNLDVRCAVRNEIGIQGYCYLFCGALVARKGVAQLLEAWEIFARQLDAKATLVLVGEGNQRPSLEIRIADSGLNNVRILGHLQRDRLPAIYHAADVFVFPTLEDCWALAVNEAMASGLPVINSKYTGSADLVVEGKSGWVVDPLNRSDIARGLQLAWDAQDKRSVMGRAARRAVAAMNVPAVAERVRRVVNQVRPPIVGRQGSSSQ